jgi:hypothetical protein
MFQPLFLLGWQRSLCFSSREHRDCNAPVHERGENGAGKRRKNEKPELT